MNWCWQTLVGRISSSVIIFIGLMLLGSWLSWQPVWQAWPSQESQTRLAIQLRQTKQHYLALLKQSQQLNVRLPNMQQVAIVNKWLAKTLHANQLQIIAWQPEQLKPGQQIKLLPITATLRGNYVHVARWLNLLDQTLLVQINAVSMRVVTDKQMQVKLQLTIVFGNAKTIWQPKPQQISIFNNQLDPFFPTKKPKFKLGQAAVKAYAIAKLNYLGEMLLGVKHYALIKLPNGELASLQAGEAIGKANWRIKVIGQTKLGLTQANKTFVMQRK